MFEYIRGRCEGIISGNAVLECGGVGWSIVVSQTNAAEIEDSVGNEVLLYIHHIQREDAQELYGFLTREERALFRKLMMVSGVGPKQAMRILSGATPALIAGALINGDAAFLSGIPGVGAKTAQKLVFELGGKMDEFLRLSSAAASQKTTAQSSCGQTAADCYAALQALGYAPVEARAALQEALQESAPAETVEDLIKRALRYVK